MRIIAGVLTLLAATVAEPATAQIVPTLTLVPGEAITIRFRDDSHALAPQRQPAEWSQFDVYAARHFSGITPPDAPVPTATPFIVGPDDPKPDPISPGQLRMRFFSIAGQQTILVVENGLAGAIAYRARMTVSGETRPTDVCVVMAGYPSYEHWPHPIERIELSEFRYVPFRSGQTPTCE